ncbi:26S proteasome non-ATPase regulatory subunit 7 [Armadillidium nasatum]|uniref:26S proteasome non-ATPase regulatory subunit 7 n=1 Tax=Armadillidium nasatum TaxID=96803 RepID=A0A5N5T5Q9_9CRUS|nr:26S proteasome non-ATPase regulatory subunit 7 [Armadillidium nasatum]
MQTRTVETIVTITISTAIGHGAHSHDGEGSGSKLSANCHVKYCEKDFAFLSENRITFLCWNWSEDFVAFSRLPTIKYSLLAQNSGKAVIEGAFFSFLTPIKNRDVNYQTHFPSLTSNLTLPKIPFDEDDRDKSVWFLDHDYLENKYNMFKKVNAREKIVGWYHTGPKLHQNDIAINDLIRRYCSNSVLVIIDAHASNIGLPTEAYYSIEEVHDDGTPTSKTFEHVASEIGAEEAEEVGVEHLLRDIKDTVVGSLGQRITTQLLGLRGLHKQLSDVATYLQQVVDGQLPVNHVIVYHLQDMFNLLPDVTSPELVKSLSVKTNDQMLVVYLASLIRSIIALHNLINNKLANTDAEKKEIKEKESKDKKEDKEEKEKEKKEEKKTAEEKK